MSSNSLLRELGLAQVDVVGLLGLLQLLRVGGEVRLQLLQLARERAGQLHVAGAVVGEDAALQILRARGLPFDLHLEPLGDARHPRERQVVLRHLLAELVARRFHQRFGIGFFEAADEQSEKAAEQPSDAGKHG